MENDRRIPLAEGTALALQLDNGGAVCLRVGAVLGAGGSCLVYRGVLEEADGFARSVIVREFYPHSLSLPRREDGSVWIPPEARAGFERLLLRFRAGIRAYKAYYEADAAHAAPRPFGCGSANGTVYTISDPGSGLVLADLDREELTLCRAARIAVSLCRALEPFHAHGLVYLDCKPDNIFLSRCDGADFVGLFDFDTVVSLADARAGRCEYVAYTDGWAPPEQKRGEAGIGSDVFSAGAVFFWLLTGRKPTADSPVDSDLKRIAAGFPWRAESSLCADCPEQTLRLVQRVAARALSVSPDRRYESAGALAADLETLAAMAAGDSRADAPIYEKLYRLNETTQAGFAQAAAAQEKTREAVRKASLKQFFFGSARRTIITLAAVLALAFAAGALARLGGSAAGSVLEEQTLLADGADGHLVLALSNASHQYDMGLNNWRRLDYNRAARDIQAALGEISGLAAQSDLDVARVNNSLGCLYLDMGRYEEAYDLLNSAYVAIRDSLGADSLEARAVQFSIAQYDCDTGDFESALKTAQEILDRTDAKKDPTVLTAVSHFQAAILDQQGRYDDALALYQTVLTQYEDIVQNGKLTAALADYTSDPALDEDEKEAATDAVQWIARTYDQMGRVYMHQALYPQAETALQTGLALCLDNLYIGKKNTITAGLYTDLARLNSYQGAVSAGLDNVDLAMCIELKLFDYEAVYPGLAEVYDVYGDLLLQSGDPDGALAYYRKALSLAEDSFGENHPQTAAAWHALGLYYSGQQNDSEAARCLEKAVTIRRNILGQQHPETAWYELHLADALSGLGRTEEAAQCVSEAASICEKLNIGGALSEAVAQAERDQEGR